MRKLIAPALVALFAIVAGMQAPTAAQPLVPSGAFSEGMSSKAKSALSALQTLSPETLFEQLAPWKRTEMELYKARIQKRADAGKLRWDRLEKTLKGPEALDPADKLALSSLEDYLALSPAKLLGLHLGLYRAAADGKLSLQLADRWFEVDRSVGLMEPRNRGRDLGVRNFLMQGGQVVLENVEGSRVGVLCTSDGHEWFVVNLVANLGTFEWDLADTLEEIGDMGRPSGGVYTDRTASEGEQMLGSMKGQARVAYAKMGEAPRKLLGAIGGDKKGAGVVESELAGKYYRVRDAVYGNDDWGALVAEPVEEGDTWVLLRFLWGGGDGTISHYESKADLEAALKKILEQDGLPAPVPAPAPAPGEAPKPVPVPGPRHR